MISNAIPAYNVHILGNNEKVNKENKNMIEAIKSSNQKKPAPIFLFGLLSFAIIFSDKNVIHLYNTLIYYIPFHIYSHIKIEIN